MKKLLIRMLKSFQHNDKHYFEREFYGEKVRLCARCLGQWSAIYVTASIFAFLFFTGMLPKYDLVPVFLMCWGFAFVGIIDWASVRVFHLWGGDNRVRFITGLFIGVGSMLYVFLMPTNILFNIASLYVFYKAKDLVVFRSHCHDSGLTLKQGILNLVRCRLSNGFEVSERLLTKLNLNDRVGDKGKALFACAPGCASEPSGCACPCSCGSCCGGGDCCSSCGGSSFLIIGLILLIILLIATGLAGKSGCGEDGSGCCSCGCCGDCGCCGGSGKKEGGCCGGGGKSDTGGYAKKGAGSASELYAEGNLDQWGYDDILPLT